MKRKLLACTTSLMLLLSVLLVGNVSAHPVTLIDPGTGLYDSSRTEWFGTQNGEPPDAGTGMIERDSTNRGEFVFNDFVDKKVDPDPTKNDHRVITGTSELTKSTDLDWFAITGDASNVYFLAKVDAIRGVTLNPIPELMVSIDTGAGGNTALPGGVGVNVNAAAAWDYVIQSDFTGSVGPPPGAQRPPKRWTPSSGTGGACAGCQAQLVGASNGGSPGSFIEIKVPWGTIGGKPTPDKGLRFTATIYRKDHQHPNDGFTSALIDAASTKKTIEILSQDGGTVNTYFDLHFDANGEVFSPVLISEFQPNPSGTEPGVNGTEWIEIYNPNNFSVDLSQYKIGDAARKGGTSEAMLKFPNSTTIAANGVVIVVGDKNVFNAKFPGTPGTILGQNQLSVYSAWAAGPTIGLDNQRDQIVLLDSSDTIGDFVEYTFQGSTQANFTNSVPITFPPGGTPDGNIYSYERCPAANDTNNADVDFLTHDGFAGGAPTPGVPCPPATGVDLRISKTASPPQVLPVPGNTVTFLINWSNNGDGAFSSVLVTDTLPSGVNFVGQSSKPTAAFTQSPGPGQPMQWTFTNLTTNVSGTIILTTTVDAQAPANTPLVNTAGVQSGPGRVESPDKLGDNFASASVTSIKPDLKVESTWPGGKLANTDFTYVITATNHGVGDASSVLVTDTLPTNSPTNFLTFVAPFPAGTSVNGQKLTWNVGDLGAGASTAITVKVHLGNAPAQTTLHNLLTIGGLPPDEESALADNTEDKPLVVGVIPDLNVSTVGWPTSKVVPGSQFCYSIAYGYNPTGAPATNLVIKDALPQGLTLISQSAPGLIFNNATTGDLIWTKASISAGQSGTIQLCVRANTNAVSDLTVQNVVTITGQYDSIVSGNNIDTKSLTFDKHKIYMPIVRKP